jgi:hypothetical protein
MLPLICLPVRIALIAPSIGFASGRQACKILLQLIYNMMPSKWWAGQFLQQEKKEIAMKFPLIPGS